MDEFRAAQKMQAGDLVEMASVRSHTQGPGGSARVVTHKESVRVAARNMKCCGSVMVSKEAATELLVAKHMKLFVVALMHVATFAVLGMWTTFWPFVWIAVPAALFSMVAAGLIGTAPTATARETIASRAGAIKMCAVASLILTIVSFLAATALGGLMVAQAVAWDADKKKALNCDHDESKNEFGPWCGEMWVMHSGCTSDDDCTGARWCEKPDWIPWQRRSNWGEEYGVCTGDVAVCDAHPAIPESPISWAQARPARLGFDPPSLEGYGECYPMSTCKGFANSEEFKEHNVELWGDEKYGEPGDCFAGSPEQPCLCSRGSAVLTGATVTCEEVIVSLPPPAFFPGPSPPLFRMQTLSLLLHRDTEHHFLRFPLLREWQWPAVWRLPLLTQPPAARAPAPAATAAAEAAADAADASAWVP